VSKPRIWLEREPLPDLVAELHAAAEIVGPGTRDDPPAGIEDASGAIAGILTYGAELMDRAPGLRVICRTGIGVDTVDVAEATRRGIAVCNAPDGPTISTAEHAIALMLAAAKHLKRSESWLRAGETNMYARHEAVELDGKTLGLVGYGRIPRRVAAAAHGLGMEVIAYDPHLPATVFAGARRAATLDEVLATADVVSVHVPLTEQTRNLFDSSRFAEMKPGAVFVNTARGGVVDQNALLAALDSGRITAAGLDVTDPEPLPADHPLLNRDDVVVTPHVASGTYDGKRRIFRSAFAQAVQVLSGEKPPHLVNPEVWEQFDGGSS
jgi:phosphoglycerate dehydrogenase-like enzyme